MKIRLTVTGRMYHHAGGLPAELELPEGVTLRQAINRVNELLPPEAPLSAASLIAVAGQHVGNVGGFADRPLRDGEELTIIAPVAGG